MHLIILTLWAIWRFSQIGLFVEPSLVPGTNTSLNDISYVILRGPYLMKVSVILAFWRTHTSSYYSGGSESTCQCRRWGSAGSIPGLGRSPGGGNATHSSILAWRIPWTEKPGGLQSMGLQRSGQYLVTKQQQSLSCSLIADYFAHPNGAWPRGGLVPWSSKMECKSRVI